MFTFPAHLDHSVVSDLENYIIEICNTCPNLESISVSSKSIWTWATEVLHKPEAELRHEIETHELDEHFPSPYLEEKDHLLKLPLLLLEKINS